MYSLSFLLFITVAWCQSTIPLIPVKKGYFDISPSTTQVTLTSQSGSLSDSIDLNDSKKLFGGSSDYSNDPTSGSPQKLINFFSSSSSFSSDSFQFHPVYNMVSDIASNVCLMSLSSKEEEVSDAVDPDAAIKKIGTLTSMIMADLASITDKPQTLLHLYNTIKSENSLFNTAELSSPGGILKTNGLNSRVKVQVKLSGYPSFDLGVPLRTESHSKETQCIEFSKLAAIHTLNKITRSAIHALKQCTTNDGVKNQLDNNNGLSSTFQSDVASSISTFAKEVANLASSLDSSDVVTEAISISNNAVQIRSSLLSSSSIPVIEKDSSSLTKTSIPSGGSGSGSSSDVDGGNINLSSSNSNIMESNMEYNSIQPMIQEESVNEVLSSSSSPSPSNYEGITPIQPNTEQLITTIIPNNGNTETANTNTNNISTTSGTSTTSDINTITNTENPTTQSILPSIPNIVRNKMVPYNKKTGVPVGGGGVGPSAFFSGSNPNPIIQTKPKMNMLPAPTRRREEIHANPDLNTRMKMMMGMMMMNRPVFRNRMSFPNSQGRVDYNTMN